ncbi:MAG: hypothetical protein K2L38_09930 [Dysosmobacter sp.]|nr:hypothetical protein [Dysosmobacter sp.]
MEMRPDVEALRGKYQKIMAKFAFQGREPEAKERLRHLFHNQMTSVSSLAPEPEDWNAWTEECVQNADWPGLCRVISQRGKSAMMPVIYGGYAYEKNVHCALECILCGNVQAVERILPPELARVNNCCDPFFPAAAHVLIGLWYKDKAVLERAVPGAERFLEGKRPNLLQKAMVSFLLDLVNGGMDKGSEDLLAVCKGYPKDKRPVLGVRPFCTYAHGLYCLAQLLLPEEKFQALQMPEYKNFLPEFALWRRAHPEPDLSLWFRYPEDMALFNDIYAAPPARLVLMPPAPDGKKQEWFAHGVKWTDQYVDELWNMGIGGA